MAGVIIEEDEGAAPTPAPGAPKARGPIIIDDGEGSAPDQPQRAAAPAQSATPSPLPDDRGILETVWDGVKWVNRKAADFNDAAARKVAQLATFGLADDATAAVDATVKSATGDKPWGQQFQETKAAYNAMDAAAAERSPAGNVAGNLVGLALPYSKAKTALGGVAKTVGRGGLAGAGASDADVTKDGGFAQLAKDTAVGAAAGTAVAGAFKGAGAVAGKVFKKAPERVENRQVNALLEGTPAKTVQDPSLAKLGGKPGLVKAIKNEGLEKPFKAGKPAALEEKVAERLDDVGGKLGKYYEAADKAAPGGIPLDKVKAGLEKAKARYAESSNVAAMDAVDRQIAGLERLHGEKGFMSAKELHRYISDTISPKAFSDTGVTKASEAAKLAHSLRGEAVEVLQAHVDDVSRVYPPMGSLAELRKLNDRYGKLRAIEEIAHAKATREERYSPSLGQRMVQGVQMASNVAAVPAAVGGIMSGNNALAAAGVLAPLAARAAPHAAGAVDQVAVFAQQLRQRYPNVDEFLRRAALAGIPRSVAIAAAQSSPPAPGP